MDLRHFRVFIAVCEDNSMTAAGKQLLEYATHIVSLTDEVEAGINDWDSFGTLRVGSSIAIGFGILP